MKKIKNRIIQFTVLLKYIFVFLYCKIKKIDNSNVWLIADRGDEARDNGFCFYKYLKKEHPEIEVRFVITNDSLDNKKIEENDRLIKGSFQHYILFITAGYLVSSHLMGYSPEFRLFYKLDKFNLLKIYGKKVFLQHGITKDNISMLSSKNTKLSLFICGAKPEYDFLLNTSGFDNNILKYTGFARYDTLRKSDKNIILIMPTWRKKLFYCSNIEDFKKTDYFKNWYGLLKNKKINEWLKNNEIKLVFYPHYEIQEYINAFDIKTENIIIANKESYDIQNLLNECKMLITDYSSVFFDIGYLKKPMIFFQFDYEDYRKNHYKEGWFDYKEDGFGKITYGIEETINEIEICKKENFEMKELYKNRVDKVFIYNDTQNSKRIFEEILKLGE